MNSQNIKKKIVKVQSSTFTGNFLWKYRDHIYQPMYEEVIVISQGLGALQFQSFNKNIHFDKVFSWFLVPSSYFIFDRDINSI
jgi:hypothetical protein